MTRLQLRCMTILWIVGLVAVSLQPWRPHGESQSILHNVLHVVLFGAPSVMLFALSRDGQKIATSAVWIFCLAMAIETGQHLLYRDPFEWWDVRDDTIGLLLAAVLIRWTRIRSLLLKTGD